MANVRSELENQAEAVKDGADGVIEQAREFVKEHVPGSFDEVKDNAMNAVKKGKSQVKKNPGQSMLTAVAFGFGLAMLCNKARGRPWL